MTRWLAVTLMAPLASFGERAGNVERSTADRPTRSALIGLAGAALGIRREDASGQADLASSFRVASRTVGAGSLVTDFHTFQSLPSARGRPATRAAALARRNDLETSITRREYRADVWHEAAYAALEGARWSLEELGEAFRRPRFTLFLGRKSCPLAAPLAPEIIADAGDVTELFRQRLAASAFLDPQKPVYDRRARRHRGGAVATERREDLGQQNRPARLRSRHDEPGDRRTWQFASRQEFLLSPADDERAGGPR